MGWRGVRDIEAVMFGEHPGREPRSELGVTLANQRDRMVRAHRHGRGLSSAARAIGAEPRDQAVDLSRAPAKAAATDALRGEAAKLGAMMDGLPR